MQAVRQVVLLTIEEPRHLKDNDVVEYPRVVVLEEVDHVLDELHVHVLHPRVTHVKEHGDPLSLLLPAE